MSYIVYRTSRSFSFSLWYLFGYKSQRHHLIFLCLCFKFMFRLSALEQSNFISLLVKTDTLAFFGFMDMIRRQTCMKLFPSKGTNTTTVLRPEALMEHAQIWLYLLRCHPQLPLNLDLVTNCCFFPWQSDFLINFSPRFSFSGGFHLVWQHIITS